MIKSLKEKHTGDQDRDKAGMIFSTVHRAKGMEYDVLYLVNDFTEESKIKKMLKEKEDNKSDEPNNIQKWNEEINLLYVAITRTKTKLHIPENLLPENFPVFPNIQIIKNKVDDNMTDDLLAFRDGNIHDPAKAIKQLKGKAYGISKRKTVNKESYKPWTMDLDNELKRLYEEYNPISDIAKHFGRTKGAIIARLKRLDYFMNES